MTWVCEGGGCDHSGTWPNPTTARIWCSACTGYCSELSPCVRGRLARLERAVQMLFEAASEPLLQRLQALTACTWTREALGTE